MTNSKFLHDNPEFIQPLLLMSKNIIKASSQKQYTYNIIHYAHWCFHHNTSIDTIDHYQIASYLLEIIGLGLAASTIRNKKAAIGWWYGIWQQKNSKSVKQAGAYDPDHPILTNINRRAKLIVLTDLNLPAIAWTRLQILCIYNQHKSIISNHQINTNYVMNMIFIITIVTGARIHTIIPYRAYSSQYQGITFSNLFILYDHTFNDTKMNHQYGPTPPYQYWPNICGLRLEYTFSKTTPHGYKYYRYIGRTRQSIDPVLAILKLFKYYATHHMPMKQSDYLFQIHGNKPITYNMYNKWIHTQREQFSAELGPSLTKRLRIHSSRKAFVTILDKIGFSESRISALVGWKNSSMMAIYNCVPQKEMLKIAPVILFSPFKY